MMAGAEGLRRVDFDGDAAAAEAAMMRAVDQKTAGRDGTQVNKALGNPILGGKAIETERLAYASACHRCCHLAHRSLFDRGGKVERDLPLTMARIRQADRRPLVNKRLGKAIGETLCRLFIGC